MAWYNPFSWTYATDVNDTSDGLGWSGSASMAAPEVQKSIFGTLEDWALHPIDSAGGALNGAGTSLGNATGSLVSGIVRPLVIPILLLCVLTILLTVFVGKIERVAGGS